MESNKELLQQSVSDLMNMREEVEEVYGKVTFYRCIGKDIVKLLGL